MRILYLAQRYDYGNPSNGLSFEHFAFYESLRAMGHELIEFDYPSVIAAIGRTRANRKLEEIVFVQRPDVLFGVVRRDLISKGTMRRISEKTRTTTINWFCDDHWQFDSHALKWTPCFNYVVTTSQRALHRYQSHGLTNVIKSQWGANDTRYQPAYTEPIYDVTFVGQPYGIRQAAIERLQRAGIKARAWGSGWPAGKLTQDEMIRVFSQSRINLNFADASSSKRTRLEALANSHAIDSLRSKPALWRVWSAAQKLAQQSKQRVDAGAVTPRQIKGRVFEVPACGGFLLTQPAENLHTYLRPSHECATFDSIDDLVERVRYYLKNEDERRAIAQRGYRRTISEHTYAARFANIFERVGLLQPLTRKTTRKAA